MITRLRDVFVAAEATRRTIEVYSPSTAVSEAIADQFETKNVAVTHLPLPKGTTDGFVIVRDDDGQFLGTLGLDTFEAVLSPAVHPPWRLAERDVELDRIFTFLDDTLFTSYDRRQMLATAREIEERAWRIGAGTLYAGFQTEAALLAQTTVYEHLARHDRLSVRAFVSADWDVTVSERIPVISSDADEIGDFWFVVYDGGPRKLERCALIAEERAPGSYYGFWTYDSAVVEDLVSYLDTEYADP